MRAKPSSNASEMYSCSEPSNLSLPSFSAIAGAPTGTASSDRSPIPRSLLALPARPSSSCPTVVHGDGLLHDARNLIGALGLYCDLLSMPGVLKKEHRHYAEEVRLLGVRSAAMIQRLMETSVQAEGAAACSWLDKSPRPCGAGCAAAEKTLSGIGTGKQAGSAPAPASLRAIVERCSGLLDRVACGKTIEISYGVASAVPVRIEEEAVERILVNLVRNAAAALTSSEPAAGNGGAGGAASSPSTQRSASASRRSTPADPTDDETPGSIRIGVGQLANRVGDPKPWPFRRVRLTVEDSGCGMTTEQLERLMSCGRAPSRGSHGIGFRVVRELAAASRGDLRVMSAPGVGTRVQIEWPMAVAPWTEASRDRPESAEPFAPDRLSGYSGPPRLGGMRRIPGRTAARMMAAPICESGAASMPVAEPSPRSTGGTSC